jgi:hypothetical protein
VSNPTREELMMVIGRDHYERCDSNNFYCEVTVNDSFHNNEMSGDEAGRTMYKVKLDYEERLHGGHYWAGGKYICHKCRDSLRDMVCMRPHRTRKSLRLPSKPALVRRLPT